jgi:hypothetical protein
MWRVAWVVMLGCGRFGFGLEPQLDAPQHGVADTTTADACTLGPWGPATPISELTDTVFDERDPAIRSDDLELVFVRSTAADNGELFTARRASPADPFGPAVRLAALDTVAKDDGPALSRDGLRLYWKSEVGGVIQLWWSTRTSIDVDFASAAILPGGPFNERAEPSISSDDLELFQASTMGHLYVAGRSSSGADFGVSQMLGAPIDSANWLEGPAISHDGLTLFFVEFLAGVYEIRVATRPDRASPFGAPLSFPELAGGVGEWGPELSADGRTLYFYRYIAGQADMFTIHRDCL